MRRYLETLFRRKGIFLTPILVTPLIALALLAMTGGQQEVKAALWAERSPYLEGAQDSGGRTGLTPNEKEAQALNELLETGAFRGAVLEQSGLARNVQAGEWPRLNGTQQFVRVTGLEALPLVGGLLRAAGLAGPASADQAMGMANQMLRRAITVTAEGNNLIIVAYRGDDPWAGAHLVNTLVDVYQDWTVQQGTRALDEAVEFQTRQVELQEERVQAASTRLNEFLRANPAPRAPGTEAEAERLRRAYGLEQALYEDTVRRLGEMRSAGEGAIQGRGHAISVIDAAEVPEALGFPWRLAVMTLFLGLLIGAGLGAVGIAMIAWTDSTVRSYKDLEGLLQPPITAQVPALPDGRGGPHAAWLVARRYRQ